MISRQQYEEHSERDFLTVPLASYHFDEVTIPLHWHREVELILTETAGSIELEGQSCPYSAGDILCINKGILHRTSEPMGKADLLVFDLRILLSPLLEQDESLFINQLEKGRLLLPVRIGRSEAGYSPSHYIRVFRLYTGQTPVAFLNDLRLEKAAACLRQGMTVTETAMQVGISNSTGLRTW